jgi:hypothetical protein
VTDHPITPPPELLDKWDNLPISTQEIFVVAAQWGADQELEACCEVLAREWNCAGKHVATNLHMIRRPKPSSLKEQALETLNFMESEANYDKPMFDTIRRALEALPE